MLPTSENVGSDWALFSAYRDRIHRYILSMVRDPGQAEDLAQETLLRACRRADTLRDPNAARGWLYRVATNVCVDHLRKRSAYIPVEEETSACVQRCLDYLSDSYRVVLLLSEVHGLSAAEIAESLGVEVGAAKIRLHRARRKLQQLMEYGCAVSFDASGTPACQPKCGVKEPQQT
jgi:RNA polymerase sigma-70 factor (ECF subfamily)